MHQPAAVRARGLTKTFGDVVALDGVDLDLAPGRIHGLVGPNGAGKTTVLGLLLGLARPDSGTLEVLGVPVGQGRSAPVGVAGFVDGPGLYPQLTARRNLSTLVGLRGPAGRSVDVDGLLDRVGLGAVAGDTVRGFSLGMRQRLGLAAAIIGDPRLLVLDEPANGLDPAGKRQVHELLADRADRGTTVVLSSHRMDDLAQLCDEVTLLATGRVVFSGTVASLAERSGELDHRVVTSDPAVARHLALGVPGLETLAGRPQRSADDDALLVRGPRRALDDLVRTLVGAGLGIRELAPVVPPLEAAFLALTGAGPTDRRADAATERVAC